LLTQRAQRYAEGRRVVCLDIGNWLSKMSGHF
jgi:predicted protein tyrosine phosphatase